MKFSKTGIWVIAALSLLSLGSVLLLHLAGFRFFTIATPSMGETAPVGTLIVTQPQQSYAQNDIISFYRGGSIYTHRLIKVQDDHTYITKGDLNATEDALPVAKRDVIGKAVVIAPIWGWVWRAAPILLIGWIVVYLISCIRRLRERWRWPIRIVGGTLVIILATLILNPWLRADMLSIATHQEKEVKLHIVNTGIFPIRDDDGNRIHTGQTTIVRATETDAQGRYVYVPRPSLGPTGVFFALLWCLLPLFVALLVKLPPPEEEITGLRLARERRRNMSLLIAIIAVEIILLSIQLSSLAAFTAQVENSQNSVSSRTYFKCTNVVSSSVRPLGQPRPYFAWGMNGHSAPLTDLSGNNRPGIVAPGDTFPDSPFMSDIGCIRDTYAGGDTSRVAIFNGNSSCLTQGNENQAISAPHTFSISLWFNTSKKNAGRLIGFSGRHSGDYNSSGASDRHLYIDPDGRLIFGTYPGGFQFLVSPTTKSYADGSWHHVVVTVSPQGGRMYLDGQLAVTNPSMTRGERINAGYWKVGCGKLRGWHDANGNSYYGPKYYEGRMQFVSVYHTALTPEQAREHYLAGVR